MLGIVALIGTAAFTAHDRPDLWKWTAPKPLRVIALAESHRLRLNGWFLAFTPSGADIVVNISRHAADDDQVLGVFDVASGKRRTAVDHHPCRSRHLIAAFDPARDRLLYWAGGLRGLDLGKDVPAKQFFPQKEKSPPIEWADAVLAIEGDNAFLCSEICTVEKWPLGSAKAEKVLSPKSSDIEGRIRARAIHPAAGLFAASIVRDNDRVVRCWMFGDKPEKKEIVGKVSVNTLAFSPNGSVLAGGHDDSSLVFWSAKTAEPLRRVPRLALKGVHGLAFHPSGKFVACGTFDSTGNPNVFLVEVRTGEVLAKFAADPSAVFGVAFSPAGDRLAVLGARGSLKIYDARPLLGLDSE